MTRNKPNLGLGVWWRLSFSGYCFHFFFYGMSGIYFTTFIDVTIERVTSRKKKNLSSDWFKFFLFSQNNKTNCNNNLIRYTIKFAIIKSSREEYNKSSKLIKIDWDLTETKTIRKIRLIPKNDKNFIECRLNQRSTYRTTRTYLQKLTRSCRWKIVRTKINICKLGRVSPSSLIWLGII